MKKYIYTLLIGSFAILAASCTKKFLDVEDNNVILAEQYVKDAASGQQYLNGLYVSLGKDFYYMYYQTYPELIAENIKPVSLGYSLIKEYNWTNNTLTSGLCTNQIWLYGYKLARNCSFLIQKSASFEVANAEKVRQLQAEAYAIRALVHFVMVNVFAQSYNFTQDASHPGIPYITDIDWTKHVSRVSVAQVYEDMINDLNKAISLYSSENVNTLIINKMAAKALLARIYLYKEDWQKAKELAIEVSQAVPIMINTPTKNMYPDSLFRRGESEALFQLAPSSTVILSNSYNTYFMGCQFRKDNFQLQATKDIANLLTQNPNDKRKSWISTGVTGQDTILKYPASVVPGFGTGFNSYCSYYQTLFRSSEMYLTVAEAAAKLGDATTARTYLDAIRQRADNTASNSTVTEAALLDAIYLERRKEMAFEGLRMFDLLRWKQGVSRADAAIGSPTQLPYPDDKAIAPIPAVDANNGIPQNPGY